MQTASNDEYLSIIERHFAFCPTGEGGGIDNSCSPNSNSDSSEDNLLFHGSNNPDAVKEGGFKVAGDAGVNSRYHTPWVSTWRGNRNLAASYGEVFVIDPSNLKIMPATKAMDGPADPKLFAQWVRDQGFDAFEHPQEDGEIGIVNIKKIRIKRTFFKKRDAFSRSKPRQTNFAQIKKALDRDYLPYDRKIRQILTKTRDDVVEWAENFLKSNSDPGAIAALNIDSGSDLAGEIGRFLLHYWKRGRDIGYKELPPKIRKRDKVKALKTFGLNAQGVKIYSVTSIPPHYWAYDHKFSSTQVDLPDDLRAELGQWVAENVSTEELSTDESQGDDFHVTVKYGLHTNDANDVANVIAAYGSSFARLGKIDLFQSDPNYDVLIVHVESEDLHNLNRLLSDNLPHTDTHPIYNPHVTLAYLKKGVGDQWLGRTDFAGRTIAFDSVTFSPAKDDIETTNVTMTALSYAFCPTGEGGGIDNSCSPMTKCSEAKSYQTGFSPLEAIRAFDVRKWLIKSVIDDGIRDDVRFELMKHLERGRGIIETIKNIRQIFEPYIGDPAKIKPSGISGTPEDILQAYRLEGIVRNESAWALNQGRLAIADASDGYTVGLEYSAVLDERTTEICNFAGGEEGEPIRVRLDSPEAAKLTPPNHFGGCRSIWIYLTTDDGPIKFSTEAQVDKAVRLIQRGFK